MPTEIAWSAQAPVPMLSLLAFLPMLGAALLHQARTKRRAFVTGLVVTVLELALALTVTFSLDLSTPALQFAERWQLFSFLSYHLAVDGLSVLFVSTTALLSLLLVLYGRIVGHAPLAHYLAAILVYESMLVSLFLTQDLLQFWLLALTEAVPATYLSLHWGGDEGRKRATQRYLMFTAGGLTMLFLGLAVMGWHHAEITGRWSFDLADLAAAPLPSQLQSLVFVLMFYGLSVRMAQFPFHAWLPELARHGTLASVGVFLVGSKLGIYGLLRVVLPLLPGAVRDFKPLALTLGLGGMFYGAFLALMQLNLRRLLAFAAVSHTGMLVVGVFCLDRDGLAGSLLLAINFGFAAAALLLTAGLVLQRAGSSLMPRLGGLFDPMPHLGLTFFIAALSTMAMPGTPGFDAAHLLLEGAIENHDWIIGAAVAIGNVLAAGFLLWAFQRVFLAQRREHAIRPLRTRLTGSEAVLTAILCAVMLVVGFYTKPWLRIVEPAVRNLVQRLDRSVVQAAPAHETNGHPPQQ